MKARALQWTITFMNSLCILGIFYLFTLCFFIPESGPLFMIMASCLVLFIGFFLIVLYYLEKKYENLKNKLSFLRNYLMISLRIILIGGSILVAIVLVVFGIVTGNGYYFLNAGCLVAFIMVILLIELVIRVLLPLAGIHNTI
ncbi:MAG: hypothetical protein EHM28_05465 [Spirochaetaceae bacterium]|nr:MAG: hypothetical protein EHM28_05465 [Spirochaetaceae bacterium]